MSNMVRSATGVRLYVKAPPNKYVQATKVLLLALSLLPETDVEETADVFVAWGGQTHQWGKSKNPTALRIQNQIPTSGQFVVMPLATKQVRLNNALRKADQKQIPSNSEIREILAGLVRDFAHEKVQSVEADWQQTMNRARVSAAGSAEQERVEEGLHGAMRPEDQPHVAIDTAVNKLAQVGEPIDEPPKPAPGHHNSDEFPEFDDQCIPKNAVPAGDAPGSGETEGFVEEALDGVDFGENSDLDPLDLPIDPHCVTLTTPSDFGLGASFATYVGLTEEALNELVPLLRVQFGEDELMRTMAGRRMCASEMVNVAVLLRRQHENLVRRRMAAIAQYGEGNVTINVNAFIKQHMKDFSKSDGQTQCRRWERDELGVGCV